MLVYDISRNDAGSKSALGARLADDLIKGFGERIATRARLPTTAILLWPFFVIVIQYVIFLNEQGIAWGDAILRARDEVTRLALPAIVPVAVFAFFRELRVHDWVDKIVGLRRKVDRRIRSLMADLARNAGYDHPDRITGNPEKAMNWFYSYVNKMTETRTYAFEVWEGYFVSLYISLGCVLSFAVCVYVTWQLSFGWQATICAVPLLLFLALWAVRRWSTIPKVLKVAAQQVGEIAAGSDVLKEARRRFG